VPRHPRPACRPHPHAFPYRLHATITAYPKLLRQLAAQLAATHLTAPVHANLKAKITGATAQHRFHLRIAFKAFGHARHLLARTLAACHVTSAIKPIAVLRELLPAFHEPIRAQAVGSARTRASCAIASISGPLRPAAASSNRAGSRCIAD
jgi:hypothetical protein